MKIEKTFFENSWKKPRVLKGKKNKKSFKEHLEDSIDKTRSDVKRQVEKHIMDIIV
jgi:hypothetical protein